DGSAMMANLLIDQFGPERPDAVMLDPGASSFLAGYQLAYVSHLEFIGYPIDQIQFSRCAKDLWFGGGEATPPDEGNDLALEEVILGATRPSSLPEPIPTEAEVQISPPREGLDWDLALTSLRKEIMEIKGM
ncbi:unnamed protein product, partial [Effrenium voratum]